MSVARLRVQHTSLQFSDTRRQQEHDIRKIFERSQSYPIKTGTEAGPEDPTKNANRVLLQKFCNEFNHRIAFGAGNWVAVDRKIIKPRSYSSGRVRVLDPSEFVGRGHARIMATAKFEHMDPRIGIVNQAAVHYPTRGSRPRDPNYRANMVYARAINNWMRKVGAGPALAFVNGDFNMPDDVTDWSFGTNWTSMADELKTWKNTGHGPIDGLCSYDRDGRVKAGSLNVLNDKKFFMYTDHFVVRGVWLIKPRKVK